MGAGASAEGGQGPERGGKVKKLDDFQKACFRIFSAADADQSGELDKTEFTALLNSKDLNLKLSPEEINELLLQADVNRDGLVSYTEFIPMAKKLLQRVYQKKETDWNDWCRIDDTTGRGQHIYLNKRSGVTQKHPPPNFNPERVEEYTFDVITLDDGTELTTYKAEDGSRMYMDWDHESWMPLPSAWTESPSKESGGMDSLGNSTEIALSSSRELEALLAEADLEMQPESPGMISAFDEGSNPWEGNEWNGISGQCYEQDPRYGEYLHPRLGVIATYLFENPRNTRLYFDEASGQWARMPLAWERNIPQVISMLGEMEAQLPTWRNVNEQLLVLRECDYILEDAIAFGEKNWGFSKASNSGRTEAKIERSLIRARSGMRRMDSGASASYDHEDLGTLSAAAAHKLHKLDTRIAELEQENAELRGELEAQEGSKMRSMTRQTVILGDSVYRQELQNQEAMTKLAELKHKLKEAKEEISELERKLIMHEGDRRRITELEAMLAKQSTDGDSGSVSMATKRQLAVYRAEILELKLKLQQDSKRRLPGPGSARVGEHPGGGHDGSAIDISRINNRVRDEISKLKALREDMMTEFHNAATEIEQALVEAKRAGKIMCERAYADVESITKKYRAEVLTRKLLYNQVQELRGNIRVFLRCRKDPSVSCVMKFPSKTEVMLPSLTGDDILLDFDKVYGQSATQETVFEDIRPIILSAVDGYNVCIIAYGQTGSGKTYTMMGPQSDPGVNRRAIAELVRIIDENSDLEVELVGSMLEIYNENAYDLLHPDGRVKAAVRQGNDGVYVDQLSTRNVKTQADVERLMNEGDNARTTSATKMNTTSSRSHLVLQIEISAFNKVSKVTSTGRLTLVDLAGSERVAKSGADGHQLVEAAAINKSLSALGHVFKALCSNSPHIPYRNSKLTHVLQESIGGDSKTCLFINVRPDKDHLSETHSTLLFGKNIRKVELGPSRRHRQAGKQLQIAPPLGSGGVRARTLSIGSTSGAIRGRTTSVGSTGKPIQGLPSNSTRK